MPELIDAIAIVGLRDFQAALKALDGESQKRLRVVFNDAAELVVSRARPMVPTATGRAAGTVRAKSGQREAIVMGGSKAVPYFGWLDFGGRTGRNRTGPGTGNARRNFITSGRYLYPSYTAVRPAVFTTLTEALTGLATDAGLEVG